jgi:hypothetical protein
VHDGGILNLGKCQLLCGQRKQLLKCHEASLVCDHLGVLRDVEVRMLRVALMHFPTDSLHSCKEGTAALVGSGRPASRAEPLQGEVLIVF